MISNSSFKVNQGNKIIINVDITLSKLFVNSIINAIHQWLCLISASSLNATFLLDLKIHGKVLIGE